MICQGVAQKATVIWQSLFASKGTREAKFRNSFQMCKPSKMLT